MCRVIELSGAGDCLHALARMRVEMRRQASANLSYCVNRQWVEYPIGHKRRRTEGIPLLVEKFRTNLGRRFAHPQQQKILDISLDQPRLERMGVSDYVDLYAAEGGA